MLDFQFNLPNFSCPLNPNRYPFSLTAYAFLIPVLLCAFIHLRSVFIFKEANAKLLASKYGVWGRVLMGGRIGFYLGL
jgi:hypothetical protein